MSLLLKDVAKSWQNLAIQHHSTSFNIIQHHSTSFNTILSYSVCVSQELQNDTSCRVMWVIWVMSWAASTSMDLVLMLVCCFSMTGFFTFSNSIVPGSSHVHVLEMFSLYRGLSNKEKMKKCVEFFAMSVTFCHVSIWNHFDAYYMYTIAWHVYTVYTRSCGNWHELALLMLLHDWRREIGFLACKTCFFPGVLQLSQTDRLNSDGEVI